MKIPHTTSRSRLVFSFKLQRGPLTVGEGRLKLTISTSYRVTEPAFNQGRILQKNVSEFSLAHRNWNHAATETKERRWSADRCWGLIISVRRDLGNPRIHEAANKVEGGDILAPFSIRCVRRHLPLRCAPMLQAVPKSTLAASGFLRGDGIAATASQSSFNQCSK